MALFNLHVACYEKTVAYLHQGTTVPPSGKSDLIGDFSTALWVLQGAM